MGHAEGPGLQGAAAVEDFEALPELKVDVLPQIVAFFRVGFVSRGQPVERAAKVADRRSAYSSSRFAAAAPLLCVPSQYQ